MKLFFFFLFLAGSLCGNIQTHFKQATHKHIVTAPSGIDYIYIINLDKRPEKFEECVSQLSAYGIEPYRFSAVNGWEELTIGIISQLGIKFTDTMLPGIWGTYYDASGEFQHEVMVPCEKTYFSHCMSRGAIGICLSHLSVLQDAYDAGYSLIWVMEDDIEILKNPHLLSDKIRELDSTVGRDGWDVLFTDQDTKNQKGEYVPCWAYAHRPNFLASDSNGFLLRRYVTRDLRQIGARYGAYSMLVNRNGMFKILNFFKTYALFLPYDIDFNHIPALRLFTVLDDIVSTQINAPSDNGAPRYNP